MSHDRSRRNINLSTPTPSIAKTALQRLRALILDIEIRLRRPSFRLVDTHVYPMHYRLRHRRIWIFTEKEVLLNQWLQVLGARPRQTRNFV